MEAANPSLASPPKLSRRTYLVDRAFQLKYSLSLGGAAALLSALFGGLMYLAQAQAREGLQGVVPPELQLQLASADTTSLWILGAAVVLMALVLSLFGVLLTHRVAGPVLVMNHYMGLLAKGRYPSLRPLRKGDELKPLFERLAQAVEGLRQKDLLEAQQLEEALGRLKPLASAPEFQAALVGLEAMRDRKLAAVGGGR